MTTSTAASLFGTSTTRWLQLKNTAATSPIAVGGTSTLTADILGLSTGGSTAAGNLTGLPAFPSPAATIFSSPVNGTLSAASTQFINGQATATFTGTAVGTGTTNATVDSQTQPLATGITIAPTSTTSAPGCTGLAPSPLVASSTNRAILCFTLTANAAVNFTALNVPFTANPSTRFLNAKLYRSTDNSYTTAGDNTLVSSGTINATQFTFTGFSAFHDNEPTIPGLSTTPTNFFVVADVLGTVTGATPASQPSVAPANITVSSGNLTGATVTGTNYAFIVLVAAEVSVAGRVLDADGRGIRNAVVTMTDSSGNVRSYRTSSFGYFVFEDVEVGQTYVFQVQSKRFQFAPQAITINEELTELNFSAQK